MIDLASAIALVTKRSLSLSLHIYMHIIWLSSSYVETSFDYISSYICIIYIYIYVSIYTYIYIIIYPYVETFYPYAW